MQRGRIFLVGHDESKLIPMEETYFEKEDRLQALLASYPDLLPGDQITPENPRRWLLVSREVGVPGESDEADRWSLDHLFLDQDGMPTFVECKRSSDTRGRREVVAQMLDYAANGIAYWSVDALRQAAAETAQRRGKNLDNEIRALTNAPDASDVEDFWKRVELNLRAGKVRLIFVADRIPKELRRLVEFLNEKMADVEVLAVEVKQFLGSSQKALVSRVIGITETARIVKDSTGSARKTNRVEFLSKCTPQAAPFFERMLDKAKNRGHTIYWGEVGFSVRAPINGRLVSFAYGFPADRFEVYVDYLPAGPAIESLRAELLKLGIFREGGKTLKTVLQGDILKSIDQIYDRLLDRIDAVATVEQISPLE